MGNNPAIWRRRRAQRTAKGNPPFPIVWLEGQIASGAYEGVSYGYKEISGTTLSCVNSALAVGRDLVINGTFATDTVWTKGTGWSIAGTAAHTAGTASDLTQAGIVADTFSYEVVFTVSGATAGTVTAKLGTTAGTARSTNATFTENIVSNGTNLVFSASADFDGAIDNVTCKRLNIPANTSLMYATHSGVTVGQPADRFGLEGLYDGVNDVTNAYSKTLNDFFNPAAGSVIIAADLPLAAWTDGSTRTMFQAFVDANNWINISKTNTDNTILANYRAGGTSKSISTTALGGSTSRHLFVLTWDKPEDAVKLFIDGAQSGTTQTGVGTWVGNFLATATVFGAGNSGAGTPWSGGIALVALLRSAMTPADILRLARLGGVA